MYVLFRAVTSWKTQTCKARKGWTEPQLRGKGPDLELLLRHYYPTALPMEAALVPCGLLVPAIPSSGPCMSLDGPTDGSGPHADGTTPAFAASEKADEVSGRVGPGSF